MTNKNMKGFLSFVIAVVLYAIVGLIIWNIVYSLIDVSTKTLEQLADYKLCVYSGIAFLYTYIIPYISNGKDPFEETGYIVFIIPLIINVVVGLVVNHWEGAWQSVNIIFTIIYNIVNVGYITIIVRGLFKN